MSILVVLCVVSLAVVALGVVALAVHGRVARAAIDRARQEDVPELLETSGRTLTRLVTASRRVVAAEQSALASGVRQAAPAWSEPASEPASGCASGSESGEAAR